MRSGPTFAMRCSTGIRLKAQTGPTRARRGSALFFTISPPSGSGGWERKHRELYRASGAHLNRNAAIVGQGSGALRILHRINGSSGKCGIRISQSRRTLRRAETAEAGIHKNLASGTQWIPSPSSQQSQTPFAVTAVVRLRHLYFGKAGKVTDFEPEYFDSFLMIDAGRAQLHFDR